MKFSLFALPALSVLAWAAPTSVENAAVEKRQTQGTLEQWLVTLNEELKPFTSHMTQVTAALPEDASVEDKEAAADSIMGDIAGIRQAFRETTAKVNAVRAQKQQKRQTLADLPDVLGQLDGRPIVLANLLLPILQQLNPALGSVLNTLSLTAVYVALQPFLTTELPALVVGLSGLVGGLLVALAPLLAALGGILAPIVAALL
ncbi:hypothetical protein CB0940_12042 [Cercospora beticola]|uniref:Uncharacterized protein n=1 Tax=Cercospora beticola TaxID=122368 RepID=A0A2G5IDL1_CERBT|nr:hypothetical protein CB0940_12042 [Cercospora beticola]PIB02938.1 hypothetical protein CB0940_12042 [Cercospora beticola]WPB04427.1 hypothetical protein RHO25_009073 [Cercospora beticola]CAK1356742.1 unnamed protein product [Cercospora beticola]